MRKTIVLVLALSMATMTTSCKKGMTKIGNTITKGSENDANAIIDFNNNFLDSYKQSSERVEKIVSYAEAAVTKAKGGEVLIMPLVVGSSDFALSKIKEVPSGFDKDKKTIEADFTTYKSKKESIDKKLEELKSYMNSEDYKDDKGARAETIKKEIETEAKAFFITGENIVAKIKPATVAAEEVILKDHPLKEYIVSSKSLMNGLDITFSVLEKQYKGSFNEAEAQKQYDELAKLVEKKTKMDFNVKNDQYAHKKSSFENINKNTNNFLDVYRKLIRNSKASGKIAEGDIRQIDFAYESVLNSYNSFVN